MLEKIPSNNQEASISLQQAWTPLDAQILDVVNTINRLEALTKVPMVPSEGEKVLKDLAAARGMKMKLLDEKFVAATQQTPKNDATDDFDAALNRTGEGYTFDRLRRRAEGGQTNA